jgi:hypothetical protein
MSQWVSDIMRRQQAREQALADAVAMSMGTKSASTSRKSRHRILLSFPFRSDRSSNSHPASALAPGIMFLASRRPIESD